MENSTKIPLVSSEIAGIWNSYIGENLLTCLLKHFINRVEDSQTRSILQNTLDLSNQRIEVLTNLFNEEKLPIPEGLTDKDVNINAPRLFTDAFYLQYMTYVSRVAMHNYPISLNLIARSDLRDYFSRCIREYINLYNSTAELSLSKGIYIRTPRVEVPKKVQYIKSESFMLDWFGEKRPLLAGEIAHIYNNVLGSTLRNALLIGFKQVCKDKKISDFISSALSIAEKQTNSFISILKDEGIPTPTYSDSYVTDSMLSPFSERLILNKMLVMCSEKVSSIGMALAETRRSDLQNIYNKFMDEMMKSSKDCADIMIEKGWLEQPPQAIQHENLVGV